jgi:hypothetical protein
LIEAIAATEQEEAPVMKTLLAAWLTEFMDGRLRRTALLGT